MYKYKHFLIIFILYISYFYIFHNGDTNCLVKHTIGIPCMGCGMSRAVVYMVTLKFAKAFQYHPLVFILPFIVLVFLFQETKFFAKLYYSKLFWGSILILFVVVYIIRMILYFPHTAPMDYYSTPLIFRIFK